jgi:ribosome-binding protein aMBF1 (putative translation factor)
MPNPSVQIARVSRLERQLAEARQRAGRALRQTREARGLSLRDVAPHVNLSAGALSEMERAETWATPTAERVLRFYTQNEPAAAAPLARAA